MTPNLCPKCGIHGLGSYTYCGKACPNTRGEHLHSECNACKYTGATVPCKDAIRENAYACDSCACSLSPKLAQAGFCKTCKHIFCENCTETEDHSCLTEKLEAK